MTLATSSAYRACIELQSGVITRRQAVGADLPTTLIDSRLRSGRWQQLQQGVYATFTGTPDRQALLWAAVLRAGPTAVLSHWTAAELFGLDDEPRGLIHVTVPTRRRTKPIRGAAIHHSNEVTSSRHPLLMPPRTRIEATVIDLTQLSRDFDQAFGWLSRSVGRGLTTEAHLLAAIDTRRRLRWRGELLTALTDLSEGAMSPLERQYVYGVERAHGLPAAKRQYKIVTDGLTRYLDNFYEDARLAVELDGRAAHPPERRWADSHRDNAHASIGIMTLRYNMLDCTQRACESAAQVAALLAARGVPVSPHPCGRSCAVGVVP
jgi:hypothetical protein